MRELLVISMGGCRYGVWKDAVLSRSRIHGIHWLPLSPECFSGVTEVDGRTATLFDLSVCLGHGPFDRRLPGEAIILSEDPGPGGFVYSEESETVEVDPDALLPMPGFLKSGEFEGCVVCAGEPVIIIDISLLYERAMGPAWKSASFLSEDTAPPLELSGVRDVRLFEVSGEWFAAPDIALWEEAVKPGPIRPLPLAPPYVEGLCLHDGRIRAVISFARRMGLEDERRGMLIFAREGDFGFIVGADLGRVVIKSAQLPMPPLAGRDSIPCAVVVEEEIIPLVNIPALIGKDRDADLRGAYAPRSKFASLFGKRQVKVCEFSASGITLSVPDSQVEDVRGFEAMRRMEYLHPMVRGIAGHAGKILPVLDLALCFGRCTGEGPASKMIYLRNGSFEALLLAEAVSGSRTLSVPEQRELPLNLPHQYVYGCYTDENVVKLILNVEALAVHFDREIVSDYFETIARETEPPPGDIPEKGRRAASPEAPSVAENVDERVVVESVAREEGQGGLALLGPASPLAASLTETPEAMEKQASGRTLYEKPLPKEKQHMPGATGGSRAEFSASGASGEGKGGNALQGLLRTESEACGMPQKPGEPGETMETLETKETKGHEIGGADVNAPHGEGAFERVPAGDRMKPPFSPGQAQTGPPDPGARQQAASVNVENVHLPSSAAQKEEPLVKGMAGSTGAVAGFREQPATRLSGEPVQPGQLGQLGQPGQPVQSGQSGRRPSLRWAVYALIILASVLASYLAFMLAPGGDGMQGAAERQAKADSAAQAPAIPLPVEDAPHDAQAGLGDREKGPPAEEAALSAMARAKTPAGEAAMGASITEAEHKARKGRASSKGKEASTSSAGGHTPLEGAEARSEKKAPSASGARAGKVEGGDVPVIVIRPARRAEDSARMSPNASYKDSGLYEVKRGDTLWHIARRFTGDPFNYPHIAYENSIPDPDLIFPGQTFTVRVIYGEEEGAGAE